MSSTLIQCTGRRNRRPASFSPVTALLLALCWGPLAAVAGEAPASAPAPVASASWKSVTEGLQVEAKMELIDAPAGRGFEEALPARFEFRITDATGQPVSGLYPAAWLDLIPGERDRDPASCERKLESFVGGGLLAEPEVNLNVYHVLALNEDNTITVVDPLFGFGGTKLLALIHLEATGEDWTSARNLGRVFVSMPAVDKVAVIDADTWKLEQNVDVGGRPVKVVLQGDRRFLWVATEADKPGFGGSGVTVVDAESLKVARHVATGNGPHQITFSDDDAFALVTNRRDKTVSVIDARSYEVVRRIALGATPVGIDWSSVARQAYVSTAEGEILALDPQRAEPVARLASDPGLGRLRATPDGRFVFVVNPVKDTVVIVDAATQKIAHTADVDDSPDQVSFSDKLAYIRHAGSELVFMIPLAGLGVPGSLVSAIDFPGGKSKPGEGAPPSPADAIVKAPGATAVLVANASDGVIYYYKEGMAAPVGNFRNYSRRPRAVMVVDRSLREEKPGVYTTTAPLGRSGEYDLAFYAYSPKIVACFPFQVKPNAALNAERQSHRLAPELIAPVGGIATGAPVTVRFLLRNPVDESLVSGLADLQVVVFQSPGIWQRRMIATARAEAGEYEVSFTPPEDGLYYLYFGSSSRGVPVNRSAPLVLEARSAAPAAPPGKE